MQPIEPGRQRALVERLDQMCGGSFSPEVRRKYFISGPQWAAAYQGQALFYAPTREPVTYREVIHELGKLGIRCWTTHDSDVIPVEHLGTDRQAEILDDIGHTLSENGVECSMVTTETFFNPAFAAGPAPEAPELREYVGFRVTNTVDIGHTLGASYAVYWPGSLGYFVQGAIEETQSLAWYAEALNAACEQDIATAGRVGRETLRHCLEAKPFEPQAEILLPTTDAMLAFISSGLLTHPEMVGVNPEYLHELMWGGAPRAALARALVAGKLWHLDINDGYRLKHDVDIAVGLINPLDWLNVFMLLRAHGFEGPFNLDFKPLRTTSNWGVFAVSFPRAVDRFITLWDIAGEALEDPVLAEATAALRAGSGLTGTRDAAALFQANKELLTLHELIGHRLFQLLLGLHRGRTISH